MTIKAILEATGLSQSAMARDLGIPLRTVQNWCGGSRIPPDYLVKLIAEHYGVAVPD